MILILGDNTGEFGNNVRGELLQGFELKRVDIGRNLLSTIQINPIIVPAKSIVNIFLIMP